MSFTKPNAGKLRSGQKVFVYFCVLLCLCYTQKQTHSNIRLWARAHGVTTCGPHVLCRLQSSSETKRDSTDMSTPQAMFTPRLVALSMLFVRCVCVCFLPCDRHTLGVITPDCPRRVLSASFSTDTTWLLTSISSKIEGQNTFSPLLFKRC